jgi:UPF0755 protein
MTQVEHRRTDPDGHDETEPWRHDPWDDPDATDSIVVERPRRSWRPVKVLVYTVGWLLVVVLLVAGAVGYWYVHRVNPNGDPGAPVSFTVNSDDTLETLSLRLKDAGLISDAPLFRWYVDHNGGLVITPGYYQLRPRDHMGNVLGILRTPPSQTYTKVTFPEGFTYERMGLRIAESVPRLSAPDFDAAATSGAIRSKYQPVGVDSLEGLLFPDTYQVSNSESAAQVVERMVALMERVGGQEDIETRSAALGMSPYQMLIIASMIEREAKVPEDRPKIARVIFNRLFLGMPLQIDATLYYRQDPTLPFSTLKEIDSPYNTYLHTGLPPTPIANPGRASIQAALNPAPNPPPGDPICRALPSGTPCVYLYYVVINEQGGHAFAATLAQHEANVQRARELGLL